MRKQSTAVTIARKRLESGAIRVQARRLGEVFLKVVITGGTGFIGQRLAQALLQKGRLTGSDGAQQPIDEMLLFDMAAPAERPASPARPRPGR